MTTNEPVACPHTAEEINKALSDGLCPCCLASRIEREVYERILARHNAFEEAAKTAETAILALKETHP